ncbi:MAG: hypothetical protein N2C14_09750, partial [Planctomycetales bacterium]
MQFTNTKSKSASSKATTAKTAALRSKEPRRLPEWSPERPSSRRRLRAERATTQTELDEQEDGWLTQENHGAPSVFDESETIYSPHGAPVLGGDPCDPRGSQQQGGCDGGCGSGGGDPCGSRCGDPCSFWIGPEEHDVFQDDCDVCAGWHWTQDLSVFSGVQSFAGPLDQGANGNFGFHYGLNWAFPLWHEFGLGAQFGAAAHHSNFQGALINGQFDSSRSQTYLTAGLFRRAPRECCGLQYGVAFDWLDDSFFEETSFSQLRAEFSYRRCRNEIGVLIMSGSNNDMVTDAAAV